jgi:hypothetical protein
MTDRLSPKEAEIVRAFAAALRQARKLESEKLRFALYELELYCDGVDALNADMREENAAAKCRPLDSR